MANQFYVQPAQYGPQMDRMAQNVFEFGQRRMDREQQERSQRRYAEAQQAMANAFSSKDPAAIREAVIKYPEIAEVATQIFGFTNDQTEQVARETYRRALSDPQNAAGYLREGAEQVTQLGGNPQTMMRDFQMLQTSPDEAMRNMRAGYAAIASDEEYQAMFPESSANIGTYNPRDYTTESFAQFTRTGDPSVLERYTGRTIDVGGVPYREMPDGTLRRLRIPGGQAGAPEQEVTTETVAESEAAIAGERAAAQETAKQRAKQESPEEKQRQRMIEEEARRTVSLIDRLLESDNLAAITGPETTIPGVGAARSLSARDELNDLRALSNLLTMGNLGRMSGVLSESDIRLIANAASGVEVGEYGTPVSEERLREILKQIKQRMGNRQQGGSQPEQGQSIDDLINKYAD